MSDTNRPQVDRSVDDLRNRIAAVLELLRPVTPMDAADAVVGYLGLEVDLTYLSDDKTRRYVELRGFYVEEVSDDE